MTSQNGQQIITIHILLNISRSKSNQSMKLSYLIEYVKFLNFFKNRAEYETGRLVPDLVLFL